MKKVMKRLHFSYSPIGLIALVVPKIYRAPVHKKRNLSSKQHTFSVTATLQLTTSLARPV